MDVLWSIYGVNLAIILGCMICLWFLRMYVVANVGTKGWAAGILPRLDANDSEYDESQNKRPPSKQRPPSGGVLGIEGFFQLDHRTSPFFTAVPVLCAKATSIINYLSPSWINPLRSAYLTKSVRLCRFNRSIIFSRCRSTVRTLIPSREAIF